MSSNNLIVIALTGLLLFAYTFFSNNPDLLAAEVLEYLRIAVFISGGLAIVSLISFAIVDIWFARAQGKSPSSLLKLVISLFLYTLCGLFIGQMLGWDVTALFATSALVTVVAGLALRSTLSDFLSGIALRIDQPFQIGDRISVRNDGDDLPAKSCRSPGAPSACAAIRASLPMCPTRSWPSV
ncbi:MAG: mechanosensitive ion channel family protein [Spirulinaceae cyanobacterium RM2_2_10]|nr:mechanosensitive ion channel family protein [Spirulinaceae cyanobacterium SM2_1_0]NJO20320.1 mechanosensitive ion channel family protein [Spirulinaceae cyanobacterium RM2_2_10]